MEIFNHIFNVVVLIYEKKGQNCKYQLKTAAEFPLVLRVEGGFYNSHFIVNEEDFTKVSSYLGKYALELYWPLLLQVGNPKNGKM
jgi:hypothetical protein